MGFKRKGTELMKKPVVIPDMPPNTYKLDLASELQFIQQYAGKQIWDVSVQKPVRRLLGQIELIDGCWYVVNYAIGTGKDREIVDYPGVAMGRTWLEAAGMLKDKCDEVNRANRVAALKAS